MASQILSGAEFTLAALKESDQEAFQRLLGSLLKVGIDPSGFQYGPIRVEADTQYAKTAVSINRSRADISLWGYQNAQDIRYRRIALSALKSKYGSTIRADAPTTTKELMSIFCHANGLHDRSDQVVDAPVSAIGNVTLQFKAGQFLMYGSDTFAFKPKQRQLVDVLKDTTVNGFRAAADFTPTPQALLISQMQADNAATLPYPLEPARITFGTPTKISGYRYDNTTIPVTYSGDGYYLGTVTLTYSRYDFGWSQGGAQFLVQGPSIPTTQYMINAVVAQTGLPIALADVNVETYASVPSGAVETLTITFKGTNLRYTGELTIDYKAN
ncbi:hypothetical protein D3C76_37130 [compost metagenome]